jgi:hypothetical protein
VRYDIHDTVKNWSLYSLEAYADVEPPGALHAPTVRDANDYDELDMDELDGDEVAIQIPVNGNLPLNTEGVLTWTGIPVIGPRLTFTLPFKIERLTTRITLMVPNEKATALVGSTATVYYEATLNGVSTPSQRTSVVVIGEPVTLEKPTLTGVAGDTYNPASVIGTHQEVVVPAYGFMARGQAVILHWEGRTASGSPFYFQERKALASDTQQDVHFLIDKIYATGLGSNTILKVYYEIVADGTTYASPTLELTVVGVPSNLPKPTTDPVFANGEIDPGAIVDAIEVVIEPNSSLAPGDLLTVKWLGRSNASIILTDQVFPRSGNLKIRIGKTPYIDGNTNGHVDVSYEARRNGQPVGSSQVLQLHVGAAAELPWPLPKVVDATNGEVSTWQPVKPGTSYESNTATVIVTDSRIQAGDIVAVIWRLPDGTDLTVPWMLASAGEGRVPVPATVLVRSLGQTVQLGYVVFRGPASDLVGNSALASLQVGTLPANALSELIILEAANNGTGPEFDVSRLAGDATLRVGRWPMIEVGQPVWLTLRGVLQDGSPYLKVMLAPPTVTDVDWVNQGFKLVRVSGAELKGLKNASSLSLELQVGVSGVLTQTDSVAFAPCFYTVKSRTLGTLAAPIVLEADPLTDTINLFKNISSGTIRIPVSPYIEVGDKITMIWEGVAGGGSSSQTLDVADIFPPEFTVGSSVIYANRNAVVSIYYKLILADGDTTIDSQRRQLTVGDPRMVGSASTHPSSPGGDGPVFFRFQLPTWHVQIPANLPVGSEIISSPLASGSKVVYVNYSAAGAGAINNIGSQPPVSSINFPTDIPGVGFQLLAYTNGVGGVPLAPGPTAAYLDGPMSSIALGYSVRFIKTGPTGSGTIRAGSMFDELRGANKYYYLAMMLPTPLTFTTNAIESNEWLPPAPSYNDAIGIDATIENVPLEKARG